MKRGGIVAFFITLHLANCPLFLLSRKHVAKAAKYGAIIMYASGTFDGIAEV